jgi:hypothetical protein
VRPEAAMEALPSDADEEKKPDHKTQRPPSVAAGGKAIT